MSGKPLRSAFRSPADYPARTRERDALPKDLKRRGFRFIGSTIIYAYMQERRGDAAVPPDVLK